MALKTKSLNKSKTSKKKTVPRKSVPEKSKAKSPRPKRRSLSLDKMIKSKKSSPKKKKQEIIDVPPAFASREPEFFDPTVTGDLPQEYGRHFIYVLVRDPYYIYTYWEIQTEPQQEALSQLGGSWEQVKSILRVYDLTEKNFFDVELQGMATCWTLEVKPNHGYVIEIGLLHEDGRFIVLARSNEVMTPRDEMSDVLDERWMGIDFDKMYALSGGFDIGHSSQELAMLMRERLVTGMTSGSGAGMVSSGSIVRRPKAKRDFWFTLDCEVIVYGATEADASVTFQGKKISLRPDGTFSFRFALPDGKYVFDATAKSADGCEKRTITPVVGRETKRPKPVLLKKSKKTKKK